MNKDAKHFFVFVITDFAWVLEVRSVNYGRFYGHRNETYSCIEKVVMENCLTARRGNDES